MVARKDRFVVVGSDDGHSWGVWDDVANGQVGFRAESGRVVFTSADRRMIEGLCEKLNENVHSGREVREVL